MDVAGTFPINIVTMLTTPENPYGDPQLAAMQAEAAGGTGMDAGRANRMLRLMRMAKLTKLARMRKLAKTMEAFEEYLNPGVLAVLKLVFISLFCCHLFGCLWWMVSDLEIMEDEAGADAGSWFASPWYAVGSDGVNNWHPPYWLKNDASLTMKYMHAFYWGAGMVTSLVPRDIEPITVMESIVTTSTMFFGLLLNAFVISSLNQALASMNSKKELTGKQLESIKSYLVIKGVNKNLRGRIMEYYQYLLGSAAALEDLNMFENLPPALSTQLTMATNRRLASHCAFFNRISNAALVSLVADFNALVFIPNQIIARQGLPLTAAYFINRGIVQMFTHDNPDHSTLTNTDNFGLDDFYAGCIANARPQVSVSATAVTYCDLMCLEVEQITAALKHDDVFKSNLEESMRAARAAKAATEAAASRRASIAQFKHRKSGSSPPAGEKSRFSYLGFAAGLPGLPGGGGPAAPSSAFPSMSELRRLLAREKAGGGSTPNSSRSASTEEIVGVSTRLAKRLVADSKSMTTPPFKLKQALLRAASRLETLSEDTVPPPASTTLPSSSRANGRLTPTSKASVSPFARRPPAPTSKGPNGASGNAAPATSSTTGASAATNTARNGRPLDTTGHGIADSLPVDTTVDSEDLGC